MKLLFTGTAENYPGSLVGQKVRVDAKIKSPDLAPILPNLDLKDTFQVLADTGPSDFADIPGLFSPGGVRNIIVTDAQGNGSPTYVPAIRFDVVEAD